MGVPIAGWHTGALRGFAIPAKGTADALIEIYRAKSGGRVELSSWPMLCGLWVGRVFVAGRLPIRAVGSVGVF
jgi:hypothetical protein